MSLQTNTWISSPQSSRPEPPFGRSLLYSILFHAALLLLIFLIYNSFLVVRPPLLMDLTLIGQMSQGAGLGSLAPSPGAVPSQLAPAQTNGEFSTPRQQTSNPPLPSPENPEVSVKRPLKPRVHSSNSSTESYLESLRRSAPIGLEQKKDQPDEIKTTAGVGHEGVAGTPNGNAKVEGELAARNIKREVDPLYPDWAKKQGIEAVVRFRVTVLPNGLLKEEDLQLEQTSGYRELDRVVYDALIQWEFDPLPPEAPQTDQSGIVTIAFSLKN